MEENGNSIVRELLHERNYDEWSLQVKTYLLAQGLWDIMKCGARTPKRHEIVKLKMWRKKNAAALHVIQRSCGEDSFHVLKQISSAKIAWVALAEKYGPKLLNNPSGSGHIDDFKRHRPLFDAVRRGNWEAAKTYLDEHPDAVRARIDLSGKSPLHIAVGAGHLRIVDELVQLMTEDDLLMENEDGFTVLAVAVEIGNIAIAECLIRRNKKLVSIAHKILVIPVVHAVYFSFPEMVRYLYSVTPLEDLTLRANGSIGSRLICRCIDRKLFDIPMDLLTHCPTLAFTYHTMNEAIDDTKLNPLRALASCESLSPTGDTFGFLQRWVYNCIHVDSCATNEISIHVQNLENSRRNESGLTAIRSVLVGLLARMPSILLQRLDVIHIYETKLACVQSLQLLSRICKIIETSDENQINYADVPWAITDAVYAGNVKFIIDITKANPELVWTSSLAREAFLLAIERRQAQVFSLIYGLPDARAISTGSKDQSIGGNILHKAALLPSSELLNSIPGAALQMQRELQWFKEVRTIAYPEAHLHANNDNLNPQALFAQEHKKLASDGEKWMKETSSSCTLVGALIVTITFAAAFTFPGGNNQDTGFPLLSNKILFKVFIFADAVSLFSSTTSVLVFLGILTSRYKEEDFSRSLPTKMLVGLSFLFFSIATMMIAFSAAIFIVLQENWIAILVSSIASVPVAVFVWMQFHLLVDIYMFTYGPSIFNRKVKPWLYDQDK